MSPKNSPGARGNTVAVPGVLNPLEASPVRLAESRSHDPTISRNRTANHLSYGRRETIASPGAGKLVCWRPLYGAPC
jgi:hypothetical protein